MSDTFNKMKVRCELCTVISIVHRPFDCVFEYDYQTRHPLLGAAESTFDALHNVVTML